MSNMYSSMMFEQCIGYELVFRERSSWLYTKHPFGLISTGIWGSRTIYESYRCNVHKTNTFSSHVCVVIFCLIFYFHALFLHIHMRAHCPVNMRALSDFILLLILLHTLLKTVYTFLHFTWLSKVSVFCSYNLFSFYFTFSSCFLQTLFCTL